MPISDMHSPDELELMLKERMLPDALAKAVSDPFQYALRLKDGSTIYFERASSYDIHSRRCEWIHLDGIDANTRLAGVMPVLDRGIDIRISEIVWCVDAPFGS